MLPHTVDIIEWDTNSYNKLLNWKPNGINSRTWEKTPGGWIQKKNKISFSFSFLIQLIKLKFSCLLSTFFFVFVAVDECAWNEELKATNWSYPHWQNTFNVATAQKMSDWIFILYISGWFLKVKMTIRQWERQSDAGMKIQKKNFFGQSKES